MTFSLTIQADTFDAFKAKIIALEEMFAVDPVMPEVKAAVEAAKPAKATTKKVEEPKPEPEAETPAAEQVIEQAPEPEVEETSGIPACPDKEKDKEAFDAYVAEQVIPRVTKLVAKHGKPFMQDILARFDAPKATLVPADKMPLLLRQIDEALEG